MQSGIACTVVPEARAIGEGFDALQDGLAIAFAVGKNGEGFRRSTNEFTGEHRSTRLYLDDPGYVRRYNWIIQVLLQPGSKRCVSRIW